MNIWWIFLILITKIATNQSDSELANNDDHFQVKISTKNNISRIKYLEVKL
jgi:hypothetical protein